jgi:hemerythrin superfamily protein
MRIDVAAAGVPDSHNARGRPRPVESTDEGPAGEALSDGLATASDVDMGTARTTKMVDVLALLTAQHGEVDALFEKLENATGDKAALFMQLADCLAAHATIEEKIFYPGVMARQTNELLHESVEEHLEIKRVLSDMLTMKLDSDEFAAKLSVLQENVSHHAHEEEEQKLFPMLRKLMSADELAALGNECLAMFEELMPKHPHRNVPSETSEAAPLPAI